MAQIAILPQIKDLGANFFLTEANVGSPRASCCVHKLQELNSLVKVQVHSGTLTEDVVSRHDVVVMTVPDRDQIIRWNEFCRNYEMRGFDNRGRSVSRPAPIRFICVATYGVVGAMFSDFGPEFVVSDKTGEPPVQRVITGISCEKEGVVSLLDPNESELAKKADVADNDHEGFISFSEVEGMYCKEEANIKTLGHSINSSGVWRAREIWKQVPDYLLIPKDRGGDGVSKSIQYFVHVRDPKTGEYKKDSDKPDGLLWRPLFPHECSDIPAQDFVRDEHGNKMVRMTTVKEHYKLKIGDTAGFSKYLGGGIMQQVYQPATLHHRSFVETMQQPVHPNETSLLSVDGEKEELGWWYPMLHILHCALMQFRKVTGRLPIPGDAHEVDTVIQLAVQYNSAMLSIKNFCGEKAALATIDLTVRPQKPPTKEGLAQNQLDALESLVGMGLAEGKALLCLSACDWDVDSAMMKAFDDEEVAALEKPIKVYKCLEAMRKLINASGVEFQPLAVFLGGVCAQEVVKHCGKFTPLNQVLYYDCVEVLPNSPVPAEDLKPMNSRYDNNIMLFGRSFQKKLENTKAFMIGCGALGCELLKNFALLGVACGENGLLTVTDGDRIEVSNLARQFLFRKQHVKMPKSITASEAVRHMNPNINVDAFEWLAMPETEKMFNDAFWLETGRVQVEGRPKVPVTGGIDIAVNALDNVKARKYVDSRCVFYHKPLLESGTEGTKFNHQVIVPGLTVSYDEGEPDAQEGEAIPMCTLRNFPSTIIHCIEWARGLFEDLFVTPASDLKTYLANPKGFIASLREQAESYMMDANEIQVALDKLCDKEGFGLIRSMKHARASRDGGFGACVKQAYELFLKKFDHAMRDLQHQFPRDKIVDGKPFWSPPKRYPTVVDLDLSDEFVASFLISTANLLAVEYGLQPAPMNGIDQNGNDVDTFVTLDSPWRQVQTVQQNLPKSPIVWTPSDVKISAGDNEEEEGKASPAAGSSQQDIINTLLAKLNELEAISTEGLSAQAADFEKDLDLNFHIDFVAAASNLRASNYGIQRATRHKTKMISGKIIAAIATSTACATALVSVELLKLLQNKPLEDYRDSSNSFATNRFQMSTPSTAKVVKGRGEKKIQPDPLSQPQYFDERGNVLWDLVPTRQWAAYPDPHTKWDRIKISGSLTLSEAIEFLKTKHGLRLVNWLATIVDANGATTGKRIYEDQSVDKSVDDELLLRVAPLDNTTQKAKIAIMRCAEMKNKQAYSNRWAQLLYANGEEFKQKMSSTLQSLIERELAAGHNGHGALVGVKEYALEMDLELAAEPGVEAVTPPIVMTL